MRYYLDTEFIDTGREIDLISIGIVCEDGRELYAQSVEFDANKASDWVFTNVLAHISTCRNGGKVHHAHYGGHCIAAGFEDCPWYKREQIRKAVRDFIIDPTELWSWCAGYDFVALCQLFGTMMDLPQGWPHYIRDLQQVLDEGKIDDDELPQQEGTAHNALDDAKHIKRLWEFLRDNPTFL